MMKGDSLFLLEKTNKIILGKINMKFFFLLFFIISLTLIFNAYPQRNILDKRITPGKQILNLKDLKKLNH